MPQPPRAGGYPRRPHWRGWLNLENRCLVPCQQLCRIRAGAKPGNEKEGRRLVRAERRPTAVRLWLASGPNSKATVARSQSQPRPSPGLRPPHDVTERDRRANSPEGDASHPDNARGMRRLDAARRGTTRRHCSAPCPILT
jgi:hypothetical protein